LNILKDLWTRTTEAIASAAVSSEGELKRCVRDGPRA
jgi:hypothetical protein